ncbi:GntR family transcriptional regulator [Faecalicatena orotica]|uniref:GntR family transcriptional regulator n=1 Tax=Faecalicatena orotica TaxID=1544 RepID=UPI003216698B
MTAFDWENSFVDEGEPLYQMVYHALHYAIISGQLKAGDHLPESTLSEYLQVSRTPIRAAIIKLEKEGLIVRKCGRAIVQDNLKREMREMLDTRNALEKLAASTACQNARIADIKKLNQINERFANAQRIGNVREGACADECFHEEIYRIADNRVLLRMIHSLEEPMYGYRIRACKNDEVVESQIQEHKAIIRAIETGDKEMAEQAVIEHICGQKDIKFNVEKQRA